MRSVVLITLVLLAFAGSPAQAESVAVYNPPRPVCGGGITPTIQAPVSNCPPILYEPEAPIVICEEPAPWLWDWAKDWMYMFFGL